MTEQSQVLVEREGAVAIVTLNDPQRRNALNAGMVGEIVAAFDEIEADEGIGAVVVTGAGRGFCAGADLGNLETAGDGSVRHIYEGFLRVGRCPLPTIAAVNGAAVGAGMNLALVADIRLAAASARFITRFVDLGLHPGGGHTWMLRRAVGEQTAMAMLLGQAIDGPEAERRGLVWRCVEDDQLMPQAIALAARAAEGPRELVVAVKDSIRRLAHTTDHGEAVDHELEVQLWSFQQPWFAERLAALQAQIHLLAVSGDAWLTLAVLVVMVAALITDRASPAAAVTGATATLFILGVIDAEEAFSGFSNPAPLTVAALYVVAGAISKTRALQPALGVVLQTGGSPRLMLARLCVPASATSAFLANTPIVAMLVPPVTNWCRRNGQPASKLLIPLSYATILGGVITAIGTSTNLVVSGLLVEAGQPGFDLFEMAKIGLPVAIVGLIVLLTVGPWLLPDRRSVDDDERAGGAGYTVGMVVAPDGPLVGRCVEDGGLRHLQGVFLVEIERTGTLIAPVGPDFVLQGGDHLRFVGNVDLVVDLQQTRGLESAEAPHLDEVDSPSHTFSEAVVGPASPLVGRTLREVDFRGRYQAAVIAIQRSGQRVREKLGVVRLRPGDMLLVLADERFAERWRNSDDFLLVARLGGASPRATRYAPLTLAVLVGMVLLTVLDVMPLFRAALLAAGALVVLGVLRPSEARDSIDLDVCIVIASAFGLGQALQVTGLAERIADGVQDSIGRFGDVGALLGLVLIVVIFTELITNAAAVALAFPIAAAIAAELGYDQRLLAVAVAVAGSASFITPIGYQTNMMVYGPGGYRFTDYMRVGIPLSIAVVSTIVITVVVQG